MDLSGKQIVVVGLGKSGIAALGLCLEGGARVIGTDSRPLSELSPEVRSLPCEIRAGGHEGVPFETADLVVVSPGVPYLPELARAERAGVPVIGELELASRSLTTPIVAIGGTNGKSTVTTAVACLLEAAGHRVFAGGNLGVPLSAAVSGDHDFLVVEVSSFQLERAPTFRPAVSVLLNVTEDHLDRYESLQAYADAKGNAFVNQRPEDVAIVPAGDIVCRAQAARGRARLLTFGSGGDYAVDGTSVIEHGTGESFSLEGTEFHGTHNFANAAAAIAAVRALHVPAPSVGRGLRTFRALAHRMALVAELDGVRYYDDSKATNVGAAVTALSGISEPRAVLVAGGRDKLGSYEPLVRALSEKGRAVVVIGEAAERIAGAVGTALPVVRASSMEQAVKRARELALPGDAVLLSPACASFDMFKSYADRGEQFAASVRRMAEGRAS